MYGSNVPNPAEGLSEAQAKRILAIYLAQGMLDTAKQQARDVRLGVGVTR